jgi:hypothetical protein
LEHHTSSHPYWRAAACSYANQQGGITVPPEELEDICWIPLGFQPLGISSQPTPVGDTVAIAAYFEPAVCLCRVWRDELGLHFDTNWIRGVINGVTRVRMFPDMSMPSMANRMQTAVLVGDEIWISRNCERTFYVITPGMQINAPWMTKKCFTLPGSGLVHSAWIDPDCYSQMEKGPITLHTMESGPDCKNWTMWSYDIWEGGDIKSHNFTSEYPEWTYGLPGDWGLQSQKGSTPGLQHRTNARVPIDAPGCGCCILSDGAFLVSHHGQHGTGPFNGNPGYLIYVPSHLLSR